MKSYAIALKLLLFIFIILSNALPSSNLILFQEKLESYQACIRIRSKVLNLNLKCENLLDSFPHKREFSRKAETTSNKIIKYLPKELTITKKVSKTEEIKLRNLIRNLHKKY